MSDEHPRTLCVLVCGQEQLLSTGERWDITVRNHLFARCETPRGLIEQVDCWPCQPTVTRILRRRTLSYLSADVHRTFTSTFITTSHESQTYKPRSIRFDLFLSLHRMNTYYSFIVRKYGQREYCVPRPSIRATWVKRSNSYPWRFLFPRLPQFRESLFSSSRILLRSPIAIRPTSWLIHCSTPFVASDRESNFPPRQRLPSAYRALRQYYDLVSSAPRTLARMASHFPLCSRYRCRSAAYAAASCSA